MLDQWYWILPNRILFDKNLSSTEKLFYVFISSLCAEKWYCWANNTYFSKTMDITNISVSRIINNLLKRWYIYISIDKDWWNKRHISLSPIDISIIKNDNTYNQNWLDPIIKNDNTPIIKNDKYNNIKDNNIKDNYNTNKKDSSFSEVIDIENELWEDEKKLIDWFIDYQYNEFVSMRVIINKDRNYKQKSYKDYIKIRDIMIENWLEFQDLANILYYIVQDKTFWANNIHSIKKLLEKDKNWQVYWAKIHDLVIANKEKNIMKNMSF